MPVDNMFHQLVKLAANPSIQIASQAPVFKQDQRMQHVIEVYKRALASSLTSEEQALFESMLTKINQNLSSEKTINEIWKTI